jgi:protocatechuate 3,4-dioxygenase beta subunit
VEGTVRSAATGETLPNTAIKLMNVYGVTIRTITSDLNGYYHIDGFTEGQYLVAAIIENFQRVQVSINPLPDETVTADFNLLPEPGNLSGVILDTQTGSPLVGALVDIYAPGAATPSARRTTGASGDFLIEGLAPRAYTVNAFTLNYSVNTTGAVVASNETTAVELNLIPDPASISGTVTDNNDMPLSNASVRVTDLNDLVIGSGVTDIYGNYVIGNLPEGYYTVIAGVRDYSTYTTGVSLEPGEQFTGLDAVLTPIGGTFSGSAVSAVTGEGLAGILISVFSPEGTPIISTNSDSLGNFASILLSPGTYIVIASSPYYFQEQTGVIIVNGETVNITFTLEEVGGVITGTVVDNAGIPITDRAVTVRLLNSSGVLLQSLHALTNGTFRIPQLASGIYQVNVNAEGYETATVGAIVTNGEEIQLTVPLTPSVGIIQGGIRSSRTGNPIPGSFAEVTDSSGVLVATITSDQNGAFTLLNIQTGSLNVKATAPDFGAATVGVIVNPGETSVIQLSLSPITGTIKGLVKDPEGRPVPDSTIKVKDHKDTVVGNVLSGKDGSFEIPKLKPDRYTLSADDDDRGNHVSTGVVLPGEEHEHNITLLPERGLVQGTITNTLTGEPLIGAAVQILSISPFGPVNKTVVTDSEGNYSFGLISEGTYTITVTKEKFGTKSGSVLVENAVTSTENFALILNPGSVTGIITSGGTPLVNTLVRLIDVAGANVVDVQTNNLGNYLIQNFNPGIYTLAASNPDYQTAAVGFTVGPGEIELLNLDLTALPGVLTGTITDQQTGIPIQGAVIQLYFGNSVQPISLAITDDAGLYVITAVAPGVYNAVITFPNYRTFTSGAAITANDTTVVDGTLLPDPGTVTGNVSGTGRNLSGAAVKIVDVNGVAIGAAVSNSNGQFSIGNLSPGTYAITVKATNYKSSTQGITITAGSTENVFFILLEDPGRIIGNVSQLLSSLRESEDENNSLLQFEAAAAGSNIAGAVVSLSLNDILLFSSVTDLEGNYAFEDLAPGTYKVTVNGAGFASSSLGAIVTSNNTAIANFILSLLSGSISGTVVDENGTPIIGQTIFINLYDQNNLLIGSVQAQPDGMYFFSDLVPGNYIIAVNTNGYIPNSFAVTVNPDAVTTLNLPLEAQGGTLTGRVINQDTSLPVSGVVIMIFSETGIPIVSAITGQNGLFNFPHLPSGSVVVSATATGFSNESIAAIIVNGTTTETVIAITPETGDLQGVITDAGGSVISEATILLLDAKRSVITTILTQNDGRYAVSHLLPGIYTMIVSARGFEQKSLSAFIEADKTTVSNVQLAFLPGSLEGVAIDANTGSFLSQVNVELRFISASGPVVASTLTDTQGRYRFDSVASGSYTVVGTKRNFGYDSVSILISSETTSFADLQLLPLTASVSGIVRNAGGTLPLINTLLRLANQNGVVVGEIQTDRDGRYFIQGLLQGEYSIAAINADYRSQVLTFTVSPNETSTVNFNLTAIPSKFTGTVTDAETGLPIIGAIVEVFDLLDRPVTVALTNSEGVYTITGLSEGAYRLRASAQGYGSVARQSLLGVNDTNIENFALPASPASISGTVTIAGNGPLANASVSVYDMNGNIVGSSGTNREGTYSVRNLPSGQITVRVDATGYSEASRELVLERGESRLGVDFALIPGAEGDVTGEVKDSRTGRPISGAAVLIIDSAGNVAAKGSTNENGVFSFFALPARSYVVRVTAAGYVQSDQLIDIVDGEILLLTIRLQQVAPPLPGSTFFYIMIGGMPLTLDSQQSPTPFQLECIDPAGDSITFSYEAVVAGVVTRKLVTFDPCSITLIRVINEV